MNVPKLRFKGFSDEYIELKLKDICLFYSGGTPISSNRNFYTGYVPFIRSGEIHKAKTELFVTDEAIKNSSAKYVKKGDLLFALYGATSGDVAISKINGVINQAILCIKPQKFYNQIYIKYLLELNKKSILNKYIQGGQGNLSANIIKNIKFNFCSFKEQSKVANFLLLLDKKIELQVKKIEALKLFKKGLLNELLKCNSCSKIPLKHILKERKEYSTKAGNLPHVTLSKNGIEEKTERYNRDFLVKSKNKKYKTTKIYDLCYNPANLKFGVICLNTYGSAIFSPIYITFEINHKFNPLYIGYYVTQQNFINSARKYEQGTVYERMAVAPEDFLKMNIYVPNKYIQDKFSTILIFMDKKLNNENEKLKKLEALKKGFMQNMFV